MLPLVVLVACGPTVLEPAVEESGGSDTGSSPQQEATTTGEPETGVDEPAQDVTGPELDTTDSGSDDSSGSSGETTGALACTSPHLDTGDVFSLDGAPIRGNPDGAVTVVQWLDYIEPFSHQAEPTLQALLAGELGAELRIVVKQVPLAFNQTARPAARAALAAAAQGAFWDYHDALMAWNPDDGGPPLVQIATDIGLDVEQFELDIQSDRIDAQIDADTALLEAFSGTVATPSFAINGSLFTGAQPLRAFEEAIAAEGQAFLGLVAEGASLCDALDARHDVNLPG